MKQDCKDVVIKKVNAVKLGKKIDALRLDAGWTQNQLAEQIYFTTPTIRDWIKGRRLPSIDSLRMLADAFLMEMDELLEGCYDDC